MYAIVRLRTPSSAGRPIRLLGVLMMSACGWISSFSMAAEPNLKSINPMGCRLGESVEITLIGTGMEQGGTLYFSRDGISAEHIEKNRFRIKTSTDAVVGDCDLWIATLEGLAGPRRFRISHDPIIAEQQDNNSREDSQTVPFPSLIDGRLDKKADLDWFAFHGQKGQQITITCRSPSLDGNVQGVFTLFGPLGRELVHSASHEREPRVRYRLPATGTYRVLVHDRAYRHDDFSFYRLELTTRPLDGARDQHSFIHPDKLFAAIEVEDEKEQSRQSPQAIELPCRVSGRFLERNDVDWFRFQAKKAQMVHVEAFGERLGQLMDLEMTIHDADKLVTTVGDLVAPKDAPPTLPLASLDPSMDWKVPADGEYRIAVRDLYGGSVFGANRVYQLIVAVAQPGFFAITMPDSSKPSRGVFVKRGETCEISVIVMRTGSFSEPVTVRETTAIRGLTIEPCIVDGKEMTKKIRLSAGQDTAIGFQSLRLVAEAQIGSDKQVVPVWNAVQIRPGATRRIEQLIVYVSE